ISSRPLRTSRSMTAIESTPLRRLGERSATISSHPQRRGGRITVRYSLPRSRRYCPVALSCSVGKGPPPTRVEYAFTTPIILLKYLAGTPEPLEIPTPELLLLVTKG